GARERDVVLDPLDELRPLDVPLDRDPRELPEDVLPVRARGDDAVLGRRVDEEPDGALVVSLLPDRLRELEPAGERRGAPGHRGDALHGAPEPGEALADRLADPGDA